MSVLHPFCISVTMAATPSHLAMDSSNRVGVVMEVKVGVIVAVGGNLEHMGAVEDRAVGMEGVEANNNPLHMELGLTTHLPTTALLRLKTTGNKVNTDREVSEMSCRTWISLLWFNFQRYR